MLFLTCIGQKDREIYETFTLDSTDDEMKLEAVLNNFSEYCHRRRNVTILRHKFFTYRWLEGQSFHDFITKLILNFFVKTISIQHPILISMK